jgi:hypothetical protein
MLSFEFMSWNVSVNLFNIFVSILRNFVPNLSSKSTCIGLMCFPVGFVDEGPGHFLGRVCVMDFIMTR